ncbi:MAG: hypothetical protein INR69_22145 [Mucilaginibacter polytrichastri]|nr:hypothetical protein [Mucilaginibacter polytrichastri]
MAFPCALLAFLLAAGMSHAQSLAQLDADFGYRDLKIGAPLDTLETQASFEGVSAGGVRVYDLYNPAYRQFENVRLRMVSVQTQNGNIRSVILEMEPHSSMEPLKQLFEKRYGSGAASENSVTWVTEKTSLILLHEPNADVVMAWISMPGVWMKDEE